MDAIDAIDVKLAQKIIRALEEWGCPGQAQAARDVWAAVREWGLSWTCSIAAGAWRERGLDTGGVAWTAILAAVEGAGFRPAWDLAQSMGAAREDVYALCDQAAALVAWCQLLASKAQPSCAQALDAACACADSCEELRFALAAISCSCAWSEVAYVLASEPRSLAYAAVMWVCAGGEFEDE